MPKYVAQLTLIVFLLVGIVCPCAAEIVRQDQQAAAGGHAHHHDDQAPETMPCHGDAAGQSCVDAGADGGVFSAGATGTELRLDDDSEGELALLDRPRSTKPENRSGAPPPRGLPVSSTPVKRGDILIE